MKQADFDVLVIGGGHAGLEAASASSRAGADTAIVTMKPSDIGTMSCNPAIGGLGKGHLVREIDAMGGQIGQIADASAIQFRLLNRRKGPAVQGPRAQSDRSLFREAANVALQRHRNLTPVFAEVADLLVREGRIEGVLLADGSEIRATSVVLTTGTFLGGVVHIGDRRLPGGRMGDSASSRLAARLLDLGLPMGRLKTGTPPRLRKQSIDWDRLEAQSGDDEPSFFSFLTDAVQAQQVSCGITHTNAYTHQIIRDNLDRSAMYSGNISGVGPRYCPSIEDKVVRFADKDSHQIFLEPEGLTSDLVYPNGISTSLPEDVQIEYVRSIVGLEQAEIAQPGYAIEYDFVDPRSLNESLHLAQIKGLYLAGQINGTTGYEEAAAQGLVAGINAARSALGKDKVTFERFSSYIGVMIDDLVTRGVSEPYRMFTSRAEYRLSLRIDNADQRLTPLAQTLGLICDDRKRRFSEKMELIGRGRTLLEELSLTPNEARNAGFEVNEDGRRRNGLELLAYPNTSARQFSGLLPDLDKLGGQTLRQLEIEASYQSYVERQARQVEQLRREEAKRIPTDFSYAAVGGLSSELRQKLELVRPSNLGQAGRIDGMTPAALSLVLSSLRREERQSA